MTSVFDITRTFASPGTFPASTPRRPLPGLPVAIPVENLPAAIILLLFAAAVAAGMYDLAAALAALLAAPIFHTNK
ncbi:hypothetical protein ACVW0K_007187 [Streptomyces filamentosus]